jgi:hypothetical protein
MGKSTLIPYKNEASTMTVAKAYCAALGYKLSRADGEFRVASPRLDGERVEDRAYYSDDLSDVVATAKSLHEWHWARAMMQETASTDCAPVTPKWRDTDEDKLFLEWHTDTL